MTLLFDRQAAITVGPLRLASRTVAGFEKQNLRITFAINKTLDKEPNAAQVAIYNLNEDHRKQLQEKGRQVIIEAGYAERGPQLAFLGKVEFAANNRGVTDWITNIEAGDGSTETRIARTERSYKEETTLAKIAEDVAEDLKIGKGNLRAALASVSAGKIKSSMVLSGSSAVAFDTIMSRLGLIWTVHNGVLNILRPQSTTTGELQVFDARSGLIGSPEYGADGYIRFTVLMRPEIQPGNRIELRGFQTVSGGVLRAVTVAHRGDTWGQDWYTDIEAQIFGR